MRKRHFKNWLTHALVLAPAIAGGLLLSCTQNKPGTPTNKDKADQKESESKNTTWSDSEIKTANDQCITDFLTADKQAQAKQVEVFCGCLIGKAQEKYPYMDYMSDLAWHRDKQAQDGSMAACRELAGMSSNAKVATWQAPTALQSLAGDYLSPVLKRDKYGRKYLIYGVKEAGVYNLYSMIQDPGGQWTPVAKIGKNVAREYIVNFNENGQGVVTWWLTSTDQTVGDILYATTYDPKTGWSAEIALNQGLPLSKTHWSHHSTIDARGNIAVSWSVLVADPNHSDYEKSHSYWRMYAAGKGWQNSYFDRDSSFPIVALDNNNMLYTIYRRHDAMNNGEKLELAIGNFQDNSFSSNIVTPFKVEKDRLWLDYTIAFDASNRMHILCSTEYMTPEADGYGHLWHSIYTPQTNSWTDPRILSGDLKSAFWSVRLAKGTNGTMFGTWVLRQSEERQNVWASRFEPEKGWQPPTPIDHDGTTKADAPSLVSNERGEAIAMWLKQAPGVADSWAVWAAYFDGFYWSKEQKVSSDAHGNIAFIPSSILLPDGTAHAVWQQGSTASDNIFSAEFK